MRMMTSMMKIQEKIASPVPKATCLASAETLLKIASLHQRMTTQSRKTCVTSSEEQRAKRRRMYFWSHEIDHLKRWSLDTAERKKRG